MNSTILLRDLTEIFILEIYSNPPKKKNHFIEVISYRIDKIWGIDLLEMSDYRISKKRLRYVSVSNVIF